ncbi:MAG: hypothetical protein AB8B91_10510 [Rubripirellula sp.]
MSQADTNQQIDPAFIAAIAREVIARLNLSSTNSTNSKPSAAAIDDHVITASIIERVHKTSSQVFVSPKAVVTPAAKDEARRLGVTIIRTVQTPETQRPEHSKLVITDTVHPERADAVRNQLKKRGFEHGNSNIIVLSDSPALEVHQRCVAGETAAMISDIADVGRFASELNPTTWVLDMKKINLTMAVNVAAQITQRGGRR